ncbi:ADP-ribosylation factor family-domain-containing protein [Catenaria anguillulae PL171]|uniref:ADP-ribosylation factor family-domain-containing protein n=1 Tax=Catenaria anguillulae PL171 TaxID=765915 RepID=A0A1Y2HWK8_9FUNG|nr:ADP-ribosylation factor family-domain-containing protein [Catenaria anguillulae PL171]
MGLILSFLTRFAGCLFGRNRPWNVVLLGPPSAGKTTILYRLKDMNEIEYTQHSMGIMMMMSLHYKRFFFRSWDIGTQELLYRFLSYRSIFAESQALVFVIDAADTEYIASTTDVWNALKTANALAGVPVLVFATKADLAHAAPVADIVALLDLDKVTDRAWHVQAVSRVRGDERVKEGFAWLERVLEERER